MSASPSPTAMRVYHGQIAEGEIEDHGRAGVLAFVYCGDRRVQVGIFADRGSAMRALGRAAAKPASAG
jgi:hypothetical protein